MYAENNEKQFSALRLWYGSKYFINGQYRKRRSDIIFGNFYRDSLRAQRFQTLITLLFEDF